MGAALFRRTLEAAARADLATQNATIRADNVAGLAFCSRLGSARVEAGRRVPPPRQAVRADEPLPRAMQTPMIGP